MNKIKCILVAIMSSIVVLVGTAVSFNAQAESVNKGFFGDVNMDMIVSVADIIKFEKALVGLEKIDTDEEKLRADLNKDKRINVFDTVALRYSVVNRIWYEIKEEVVEPTEPTEPVMPTEVTLPTEPEITTISCVTTTVATETTVVTTAETAMKNFVDAPVKEINASLPSQGEAELVIFYIDFPDCRYNNIITDEQIQQISFGEADEENGNYPFESFSAFYGRSSKGAMQLDGKVFRYTAKENRSAYDIDKIKLMEECYDAFDEKVDFSRFDGNGDSRIDATLFTVPAGAGNFYWWPCASIFGDPEYRVDNMSIGNIVIGNAEIENENSYVDYISSYLHEMGHCMGLSDYYLYYSDDHDGMHGNAGTELMDVEYAITITEKNN